jgi:calcium-dependent protein kinase
MAELRVSAADFVTERSGKLHDVYNIGDVLGQGAFGTVKRIVHKRTKEVRAVKILDKSRFKSQADVDNFFTEVSIQRSLDHPNITRVYEYFQDSKNYYLICEVCTGGELFDRIVRDGSFSEEQAARYMKDILSVIAFCHSHGVVHRDLKPENFLLDTDEEAAHLKAIDFGASCFYVRGEPITQLIGTPDYMAPEVLSHKYSEKCDEWSAGVILFVLLSGGPPFHGSSQEEIFSLVSKAVVRFSDEIWSDISPDAKDLIKKLLTKNPSKRITAAQALKHKWFKKPSSKKLSAASSRRLLANLNAFQSELKLQQATYSFIASQLATKAEKEEIYKVFKEMDTDGNGVLTKDELVAGFEKLYSGELDDPRAEAEKVMAQVDIDNTGTITYSEFVAATMDRKALLSKEKLKAAFDLFDADHSGTIEAKELKAVLGKSSTHNEQMWKSLVEEADQNGDGVIDFQEFCSMMLK